MKRFLIGLFALFVGLGTLVPIEAEAKRMGGGKSFGMQRSAPAQQNAAPTPQRQQAGAPAQAAPQKRSWMGPLAGLAAGLGLAALMSHLGLGEEMANMLLIALLVMVAFFAVRWFMRRNAAPAQFAGAGAGGAQTPFQPTRFDTQNPASGGFTQPAAQPVNAFDAPAHAAAFPPGFDADAFAREAKVNFIRLQAAFDAANLDDIREFTSPEVFAEIRLQLSERSGSVQPTDVMALNAQVLEATDEADRHIVSVRFTGQIREDGEAPADLDEIWHLAKPFAGAGGWVIVGIQQA